MRDRLGLGPQPVPHQRRDEEDVVRGVLGDVEAAGDEVAGEVRPAPPHLDPGAQRQQRDAVPGRDGAAARRERRGFGGFPGVGDGVPAAVVLGAGVLAGAVEGEEVDRPQVLVGRPELAAPDLQAAAGQAHLEGVRAGGAQRPGLVDGVGGLRPAPEPEQPVGRRGQQAHPGRAGQAQVPHPRHALPGDLDALVQLAQRAGEQVRPRLVGAPHRGAVAGALGDHQTLGDGGEAPVGALEVGQGEAQGGEHRGLLGLLTAAPGHVQRPLDLPLGAPDVPGDEQGLGVRGVDAREGGVVADPGRREPRVVQDVHRVARAARVEQRAAEPHRGRELGAPHGRRVGHQAAQQVDGGVVLAREMGGVRGVAQQRAGLVVGRRQRAGRVGARHGGRRAARGGELERRHPLAVRGAELVHLLGDLRRVHDGGQGALGVVGTGPVVGAAQGDAGSAGSGAACSRPSPETVSNASA